MLSLSEAARRNPDGAALITADQVISFAKLFDKSEAIAAQLDLARHRVRPVAFTAHSDVRTIALIHALLEREFVILPLHPRLTKLERRYLIDCAGAHWLHWPEVGPVIWHEETDAAERRGPADWLRETQLLIATSGSSGRPKLVRLSRRALVAASKASVEHLQLTALDRWLLSLGLAHVGGFSILVRCLMAEAAVVVAQPGLPPAELVQQIAASEATLASWVPTQLERLLAEIRGPINTHLRAVLVGGASTSPDLLARARAAGIPALATYGLSEACAQVATQPLSDLEQTTVSDDVGVPLPGVEIKIEGDTIWLRGDALFHGYLPEIGPVLDASGWFETSDLGRIHAGRLIALGRNDDCVVSGGEKVAPLEVERALTSQAVILAAAVVGLPDPDWGQVVAAALVLAPDVSWPACLEEIERALARELAPFKRPKRWLSLREMPLLPNGKLDRAALRAEFSRCSTVCG